MPPISLVLATRSKDYVAGLTATRVLGDATDPRLAAGVNAWLERMASAARVACAKAQTYETKIGTLVETWRARVTESHGALRADAAVWTLLSVLPAAPLLTASAAVELTGRSARAVDGAIAQLSAAGVLKQIGGRIRYRVYEATGVFELVTDTERTPAAASPPPPPS